MREKMEWTGIRLYRAEAESMSDGKFTNIAVSVDIKSVEKTKEGGLKVLFGYSIEYQPNVARLRFEGLVRASARKAELDSVLSGWQKNRALPKDMFETMVSLIKYSADTNGVLVAKALNMAPPVVGPRLRFGQPAAVPAKKR
jgi:hypothetical protein